MADGGRDDQDKPQGPTDPSGPGGIDAPAPPGGPQRTDAPSGGQTPGRAAPEPAPEPEPGRGAGADEASDGENDIPPPTSTEPVQGDAARAVQEENAATSLDEPSQ